jgi:hypothetical protein
MEVDHKIFTNENLNFQKLENDFIIWQIEGDINIFTNGRGAQYFHKWKMTLIFYQLEENLRFFSSGL